MPILFTMLVFRRNEDAIEKQLLEMGLIGRYTLFATSISIDDCTDEEARMLLPLAIKLKNDGCIKGFSLSWKDK